MTDSSATAPPRLLVFGAHPDDAEFHLGGLMALYRDRDCPVKVISATNGDAGHHRISGPELAKRRKAELEDSLGVIGVSCEVWDHHDGQLEPTLELRWQVIGEIRRFLPDLVVTHRPNDYHPDHRAIGQAVQDASYLVTVPPVLPEAPALRKDPVVAYMTDRFTKPTRLQGDVVIDVTGKLDVILDMAHRHTSQTYEWLPYNRDIEPVPTGEQARRKWLRPYLEERWQATAEAYRRELIAAYGPARGLAVKYAEAYEISEYAGVFNDEVKQRIFPFLP